MPIPRPKTLPAFSRQEYEKAHRSLASRVATMMGRKLEEGDWQAVYCGAKGIPNRGWSNLNIDVIYRGLGVEHKMLKRTAGTSLAGLCGSRLMHPSATRSIRIPEGDDPNIVMRNVLGQYAELIETRRQRVREDASGIEADMRTGWLIWESSLREFLYWEEEMLPPNPDDYWAEWKESGGGSRKTSRNLWVYERDGGVKRYSITTSAGAKIQPYFDVPPMDDPNLYLFRVQGEEVPDGTIRVWITSATARELRRLLGDLTMENLAAAIVEAADDIGSGKTQDSGQADEAVAVRMPSDSYSLLLASFPGVSDQEVMQELVQKLGEVRDETSHKRNSANHD